MLKDVLGEMDSKQTIAKLPEELQGKVVSRAMELLIKRQLCRGNLRQLEWTHRRLEEEYAWTGGEEPEEEEISCGKGHYMLRVLKKTVFLLGLVFGGLVTGKIFLYFGSFPVLEFVEEFIRSHLFYFVLFVLWGCVCISALITCFEDTKNIFHSFFVVECEPKESEENTFRRTMNDVVALEQAARNGLEALEEGIGEMKQRKLLPYIYLQEGNGEIVLCFYLMQTNKITCLYGEEGALEEVDRLLKGGKLTGILKELKSCGAPWAEELRSMKAQVQELHSKLTELDNDMVELLCSQKKFQKRLYSIQKSSTDIRLELGKQADIIRAENRELMQELEAVSVRECEYHCSQCTAYVNYSKIFLEKETEV